MTVGELTDYLQQFDPDVLVFATDEDAAEAIENDEEGLGFRFIVIANAMEWS